MTNGNHDIGGRKRNERGGGGDAWRAKKYNQAGRRRKRALGGGGSGLSGASFIPVRLSCVVGPGSRRGQHPSCAMSAKTGYVAFKWKVCLLILFCSYE
jgi:hypothetical protein